MSEKRRSRWYFGGLSSSAAACITHPLDLIKVHLQTQHEVRMRMMGMTMSVVQREGVLALYSGLSASLCRQMTYSLSRFAIYETVSDQMKDRTHGPMPFYQKVLLGLFGGTHTVFTLCFNHNGICCHTDLNRLALMITSVMLCHTLFTLPTWGGCATVLCQPLDVLKTRLMNSKGEYMGLLHCVTDTAKLGPNAFYKGLVPAGIRLIPHTVLTFIFLEQLRTCCGIRIVT
uniref:Solute carrier family 25 member 10 n=1 Tax=Hucho hucho TaxID=62062 RepID=A0A4W5KNS0_9TELE